MARRRLKKCLHRPQEQYTWKASHCRLRWRRLNHNLLFYCFPLSSLWPSVETLFADPFVKTCRCRRCCSRSRCHLLVQAVKILSLDSSGQTQPISSSFLFFLCKTCEQSTLNHQSQMKYCWLKRVPLGQRKLYLTRLASPKLAQMWKAWHSASGSA